MLAGPFYEIWCDGSTDRFGGCPTNQHGIEHGGPTKRDAMKQARKLGYRTRRGRMLCPICLKADKATEALEAKDRHRASTP